MKRALGIVLILLIAGCYSAMAQLSVKATTDRNKVALGEQFQVNYEVEGNGNFAPPNFKDFQVLGQSTMSGGGMTLYVNGKLMSGGNQSTTHSYTLTPKAVGKFTIPPGTVSANGSSAQSNSLTIEVTKSSQQAQGQRGGGNNGGGGGDNIGADNIFTRVSVDKTNPYVGEAIVATYKVYTKLNLVNYGLEKAPNNNGFYSLDIELPRQMSLGREVVDGVAYQVGVIKKTVLYPEHAGTLELDPMEPEFVVRVQTQRNRQVNPNDPFAQFFNDPFFGGVQDVKVKRPTNVIKINVKELPPDPPASFKGAVGRYTMDAFLDKPETKANDPVSLKVKIGGKGNLKLIDPLPIDFSQDIEAYDPKIADNTSVSEGGVSGNKTFEYLLIPRHSGDYKIPPVEFTYFDLDKKKYVTLNSPEFKLKVTKGTGPESVTVNGVSKEDVQLLGKDIRFIKINNPKLMKKGDEFYGSIGFYSLLISPMFLFIGFLVYYQRNKELQKNTVLLKSKKATKLARKRLSTAKDLLTKNSREPFYEEVSKAIWGYLGDKLSIPLANLSKETISETLLSRGVSEALLIQFVDILNKCEYARFAPSNSAGHMQEIYDAAINSITKMEEELKA